MRKYKMIALAYNEANRTDDSFDEVLDREYGFLQEGDKFIWSRKTKLLYDLKECAENNTEQNSCVYVTWLRYDVNQPSEYDQFLGEVYNIIKNTGIGIIVFLECQQHKNHFTLQDFQCEYGTDGGLEMFFDLIIAEEIKGEETEVCILKNKNGGLYTFQKTKERVMPHINDLFRMCDLKNVAKKIVLYAQMPEENYAKVLECYTILVDAYLSKDDLESYVDGIAVEAWGYEFFAANILYDIVYYQQYMNVVDDENGEIHKLLQSEELTNVTPAEFTENFLKERRKFKNKE